MRVILATHNPGKLAEFTALLAPVGLELVALSQYSTASPAETGSSFVENAILKARHAAHLSGLPAIADDSGLEVDALQGAPGIYSARYAGPQCDDAANNQKLLVQLQSVPDARRSARFRCALVFMRWALDPAPLISQASWEGYITRAPRGSAGFGYDPLFTPLAATLVAPLATPQCSPSDQTAAELDSSQKNLLSHRGQALRGLVAQLASWRARSPSE